MAKSSEATRLTGKSDDGYRFATWTRQIRNAAVLATGSSLVSALFTFAQARSLSIDASAVNSSDPMILTGMFVSGIYSVASLWFTIGLMGFGLRSAQFVRDHGVKLALRPGWAIGGWFVPIAQLIIPYLVLANVAGVGAGEQALARRRSLMWFWLWWQFLSSLAGFALSGVISADLLAQFGGWKLYGGVLAFNIVPLMMARKLFGQIDADLRTL